MSSSPYLPPLLLSGGGGVVGHANSVTFGNNNAGAVGESFFASIMNGNVGGNNNNNNNHGGNYSDAATAPGQTTSEIQQQINAARDALASHLHQLTSNFQASHGGNDGGGCGNGAGTTMTTNVQAAAQQHHHQQQQQHHYGITVNGFHPQVNARVNNVLPLLGGAGACHQRGIGFGGLITQNIQLQQQQQQQQQPAVAASGATQLLRMDACGATAKDDATGGGRPSGAPPNGGTAAVPFGTGLSASAIAIAADANGNIRISEDADDAHMMMGPMHARNSRERNEREQVRAKKITQLITDLRGEMHGGGWRMEMKSKYQVLSQLSVIFAKFLIVPYAMALVDTCTFNFILTSWSCFKYSPLPPRCQDYMDHLKRYHKTKEADIEQTKKLLEEQQRQQKAMAMMNARSNNDPESIASSVTNSTARSSGRGDAKLMVNEDDGENSSGTRPTSSVDCREDNDGAKNDEVHQKKRKKVTLYDDPQASNPLELPEQEPSNKKPHKSPSSKGGIITNSRGDDGGFSEVVEEDQQSSAEMSSISDDDDANMGNDSSTPGCGSIYLNKLNSNMSDMTYSNQGEVGDHGDDSASSVSSTAAVVRGLGSSQLKGQSRRHRSDRIKPNLPSTSEESNIKTDNPVKEITVCSVTTSNASHPKKKRRGFQYDYREVFLKSNVPQFIATLSGRIVVCE